jgi:sugar O-acyltransferase (sialic acid O-acetyltransferase NeuD family)
MNEPLPLLLLGCGGHARSCIDVIEREGRFRIVGLVGQAHEVGKDVLGYPVLGGDEDIDRLGQLTRQALVTVGQIKSPDLRKALFERLTAGGWSLPAIISPFAHVSSHATIGEGTVLMHGAIVNAGARVGRNCIVNNGALIEHDCNVGDHCHIATGAILNGEVSVGNASFIGSGTVVRQGTIIGNHCVIGMGQMVFKHCADKSRFPAWGSEA